MDRSTQKYFVIVKLAAGGIYASSAMIVFVLCIILMRPRHSSDIYWGCTNARNLGGYMVASC